MSGWVVCLVGSNLFCDFVTFEKNNAFMLPARNMPMHHALAMYVIVDVAELSCDVLCMFFASV